MLIVKRKLQAFAPDDGCPDDDLLDSWRGSSRLQRHAQQFSIVQNPSVVLERYARSAASMDAKALARHTVHVAAWVALLPLERCVTAFGVDRLSPVLLLTRLLRLLRGIKMTAWLRGSLRLVAERLRELGVGVTCTRRVSKGGSQLLDQLVRLWSSLPPSLRREFIGLQCQTTPSDKGGLCAHGGCDQLDNSVAVAYHARRLRILSREIARWASCSIPEREARIAAVEECFEALARDGSNEDARTLRAILCALSTALAPPRAKPQFGFPARPLDTESLESLIAAAKLQRRVRGLLIQCLQLWRQLWSDVTQIQPMLSFINQHIKAFETRVEDVHSACAGEQWDIIRVLVACKDSVDVAPTASAQQQRTRQRHASAKSSVENGAYTPNDFVTSLKYVERRRETITLGCASCGFTITSAWWFTHGDRLHVIRPQHGHHKCRAQFCALGNVPSISDRADALDICKHCVRRVRCNPCGGYEVCPHKKLKINCRICRAEKLSQQSIKQPQSIPRVDATSAAWLVRPPTKTAASTKTTLVPIEAATGSS